VTTLDVKAHSNASNFSVNTLHNMANQQEQGFRDMPQAMSQSSLEETAQDLSTIYYLPDRN
jgi:hypothetical protein